ncbi:MAG: type II toxin-antitoxin system VapC family toxin [Bacteroidota bacterium]
MRRFLLDTNICLAFVRGHESYNSIERELKLDAEDCINMISVVTKAELLSLGKKLGWGGPKLAKLNRLLDKLYIIDINNSDHQLIEAYYTIDAYSQGKLSERPLNGSAKNMGKNDLWIAATAYVANAGLVTMDGDFDHLNSEFLTVHKY